MSTSTTMTGKVILITGGGGDIGKATGLRCAEAGATVVLTDIRDEALKAAEAHVRKAGGKVLALLSDTSKEEDCAAAIAQTLKAFGGLDGVFANSGDVWIKPTMEQDRKFFDQCLANEVTGQWLIARAAIPELIKRGGGSVVFNSSMTANWGVERLVAYSAAKGGLQAMAKTLAVELGHHQIRFNALATGSVDTRHVTESNARRDGVSFEESARRYKENMAVRNKMFPLGRVGQPDDVAYCARFLLSDESKWVTGTTMFVDGGLTAGLTVPR